MPLGCKAKRIRIFDFEQSFWFRKINTLFFDKKNVNHFHVMGFGGFYVYIDIRHFLGTSSGD